MAKTKKADALTLEEKLQQALVPQEEQPYKVPDNWCWTYLKEISDVVTGSTPSKKNLEYYGGIFPFFKPADLDNKRHVVFASEYLSDKGKKVSRVIPKYSTAVCCIGSIGKCGFLEVDGTTNQQINSLIPKINNLYLFYFCNSEFFVQQLLGLSSATTISIVNKSKMELCIIPLPPLPEQQRIVDRIESLFAKLDEAKEKAQEVVDGFEERKAAILHKAFTGELTAKWRAEHGVGMDSWEASELKNFLEPMENKKPKGEEFRYIDIDSIDNINQIVKEPKKIMVKDAPSRASRGLKTNDILFSMVRPYLKNIAYIYEELSDCIASTGFYVCRCNKKLIPQFLFKFLCSKDAIDYLMKYMKGDNSPSIRQNDLLGMSVLFPKVLEQMEITRILDDILSQEHHAKEAAESVLAQIDLIKKSILAKAFRGELGTNNPEEESAVELLKACLQEQ